MLNFKHFVKICEKAEDRHESFVCYPGIANQKKGEMSGLKPHS